MPTDKMSTVVSNDVRRYTIVNLKQVNEVPLRNALQTFDKNGDGKIDISELQKIVYWYGLWKYASIGLCLIVMTLVWATFGLTVWAIDLTKDYTVNDGVLTGGDEVVKMSIASTYIPLSWATLLDRRHLDSLESLSIDVTEGSGKFSAGMYHMKVASYLHANSSYLKLVGEDGSRVWVNSGTVVLHHPDAEEAIMVCGAAACNTLAVDVKPEYLQQLVQRSAALFQSNRDFQLPSAVDGVAISKASGQGATCMATATSKLCAATTDVGMASMGGANHLHQTFEACPSYQLAPMAQKKDSKKGPVEFTFWKGRRRIEGGVKTISENSNFNSNAASIYAKFGRDANGGAMNAASAPTHPESRNAWDNLFKSGGRRRLEEKNVFGHFAANRHLGVYDNSISSAAAAKNTAPLSNEKMGEQKNAAMNAQFDDVIQRRRLGLVDEVKKLAITGTDRNTIRIPAALTPAFAAPPKMAETDYASKVGMEVMNRPNRRLMQLEFDLNLSDMGIGEAAAAVADYAAKAVTDTVDPDFMATHDSPIRRRLNEVVGAINSIGFNPNDSGSQASDSSDAATTDDETADPDHGDDWEGFSRRRLSDVNGVVNSFNEVGVNPVNFGGWAAPAKGSVQAAAANNGELENVIVDKDFPKRRRLVNFGETFGALGKVSLNLQKDFHQAEGVAGASNVAEEKVKHAFSEHFKTDNSGRRRLDDKTSFVNALMDVGTKLDENGGRALEGAASLLEEAGENVNAALQQTINSFKDDKNRRRLLEVEPLVQTERRRLGSFPHVDLANIVDSGYGGVQAKKAFAAAAKKAAKVGAHEQVFDEVKEGERRRLQLAGVDRTARNIDGTSIIRIQDNGQDVISQKAGQDALILDDLASGPLELDVQINHTNGEFRLESGPESSVTGGRRRLMDPSLTSAFENIDESALSNANTNFDTIPVAAQSALQSESRALNEMSEELKQLLAKSAIPEKRRRLSDASDKVKEIDRLRWLALRGVGKVTDDKLKSYQSTLNTQIKPDVEFNKKITSFIPGGRRRLQSIDPSMLDTFAAAATQPLNDNLGIDITDSDQDALSELSQIGEIAVAEAFEEFGEDGEDEDRRRLMDTPSKETIGIFDAAATLNIEDNPITIPIAPLAEKQTNQILALGSQLGKSAANVMITNNKDMVKDRRRMETELLGYVPTALTGRGDNNGISQDPKAFVQAQAAQTSEAGGTSWAQDANEEKDKVVTSEEFDPRRRLADVTKNVEKLGRTALFSTVDNIAKNLKPDQLAGLKSAAGGTQQVASDVLNFASGFSRRRLTTFLDQNTENIDDTDFFSIMNNGIGEISDEDVDTVEDGLSLLTNAVVNSVIAEDNEDFEENRRRLGAPIVEVVNTLGANPHESGVVANIQKIGDNGMVFASDSFEKVQEYNDDIMSFNDQHKDRRRRSADKAAVTYGYLGSSSLAIGDAGIKNVKPVSNNAVESENKGTGPIDVDAVVSIF